MKNKFKIIILFSTFYLLLTFPTEAANLNLVSTVSEVGVGQEFQIDLILDAGSQDINAAQGKIIFPKNLLELKEIADGNSIINLWVEKPSIPRMATNLGANSNEIVFSGIIPGGFSGVLSPYYKGYKPGNVFSLVFLTKKEGGGTVEIRDAKVLLNDGKGTEANLQISSFNFQVSSLIPTTNYQIPNTMKDTNPPELFTPEVSRDPNVFDGKWFLVFIAQDKESGIDKYLIHESPRKKEAAKIDAKDWIVAESPYLLRDQKLKSYIYVKAIDKAGNKRFVVLPPTAPWYRKPLVYIPVGLAILGGVIMLIRWIWRKIIH